MKTGVFQTRAMKSSAESIRRGLMGSNPIKGHVGTIRVRGRALLATGRRTRLDGAKGYLILTPEGRWRALTTAVDRKPEDGVAERAALQKSMLPYSGKYRVEGDDFITTVDISWNEIWNGTEQRRHYRIEGDRLFIGRT